MTFAVMYKILSTYILCCWKYMTTVYHTNMNKTPITRCIKLMKYSVDQHNPGKMWNSCSWFHSFLNQCYYLYGGIYSSYFGMLELTFNIFTCFLAHTVRLISGHQTNKTGLMTYKDQCMAPSQKVYVCNEKHNSLFSWDSELICSSCSIF